MKKKKELNFKAPVKDLTRIKEKGKVFKKLYIEFTYGKYEFTLPPKAIPRVIEYILLARSFDETTIYDEKTAKKLQQIDIDLNELNNFIEECINSFFSIKCQYNKTFETPSNPNMNFPHPYNISPNQLPLISPQIRAQPINYQNEAQTWPNYPEMIPQYQKYKILTHYPSNNIQSSHFAHNSDLKTYNHNNFFPQTVYNPNRVQNYIPQNINPDNHLLSNPNLYIPKENNKFGNNFQYDNNFALRNEAMYQDYNKNHLSDLFDLENMPTQNTYKYKRKLFKLDKEKHKKMLELNKERYSLKETLKKLDTKI